MFELRPGAPIAGKDQQGYGPWQWLGIKKMLYYLFFMGEGWGVGA